MKVSIIITTFNRSELLHYGLSSYLKMEDEDDIEIIVVNDGLDDDTKNVCDYYSKFLDLKYYYIGHRNKEDDIKWRCPSHAINFGVKKSSHNNIIISCAEMYYVPNNITPFISKLEEDRTRLVYCSGYDDDGTYLDSLKDKTTTNYNHFQNLNTLFPFYMLIDKENFISIGGYDEDFIGIAFDDNDIVDRLLGSGCSYYKHDSDVIHLYHSRDTNNYSSEFQRMWDLNCSIYNSKRGIVVRNENKEWGLG